MKRMVLGFIFNLKGDKVLLIKKTHPEWQKGKLNGIGGHLTESEINNNDYQEAFVREAREECGLSIQKEEAKHVGRLWGVTEQWNVPVYAYKMKSDDELSYIESMTDEEVDWYPVFQLDPQKVIVNLTILVPFAWYVLHQPGLRRGTLNLQYT